MNKYSNIIDVPFNPKLDDNYCINCSHFKESDVEGFPDCSINLDSVFGKPIPCEAIRVVVGKACGDYVA